MFISNRRPYPQTQRINRLPESVSKALEKPEGLTSLLNAIAVLAKSHDETRQEISRISDDIKSLKTKAEELNTKVDSLNTKAGGLNIRVEDINTRVEGINTRMESLNTRVEGLNTRVEGITSKEQEFTSNLEKHIDSSLQSLEKELQILKTPASITYPTPFKSVSPGLKEDEEEDNTPIMTGAGFGHITAEYLRNLRRDRS